MHAHGDWLVHTDIRDNLVGIAHLEIVVDGVKPLCSSDEDGLLQPVQTPWLRHLLLSNGLLHRSVCFQWVFMSNSLLQVGKRLVIVCTNAGQLFADPQAMNATGLATLMPGNPNFGQQMLLGAPKHLTRKEAPAPLHATARQAAGGKPRNIASGNLPPGTLNSTIQVCHDFSALC